MALRGPSPDARRPPARTARSSSLPRLHCPPPSAAPAAAGSLSGPETRSGRRSAGRGHRVRRGVGIASPSRTASGSRPASQRPGRGPLVG